MNKAQLLELVGALEFEGEHPVYFAMAQAGRAAALDYVAVAFNAPYTPAGKKAKRAPKPRGGNGSGATLTPFGRKVRESAHARQQAAMGQPRKLHPRGMTVLEQASETAARGRKPSPSSAEAIDATATEDVIKAVRDGVETAVDIADQTSLPMKAVSRILAKLTRSGLVTKSGTRRGCLYAMPQPTLGLVS